MGRRRKKRTFSPWAYRFMRLMLVPLLRLYHRPAVIGRENMPTQGPCFLIANHSGMYDMFFMNYPIRHEALAGIMTDEYLRSGILPWFFRRLGTVATRKFQPQSTPVRQLLRLIHDQRMIVLMPEGESNWDGVTLPTVASTGKLFRSTQVPVYPITLHNGYQAFPRWARWPRPVKVTIEFHPPLHFTPEMSDDEVAERVDRAVHWHPLWEPEALRWTGRWSPRTASGISRLLFRCPSCGKSGNLQELRGKYLRCGDCSRRWRVTADGWLTDTATGERQFSTTLFQTICKMPRETLDFGPQGEGLIRTLNLPVYRETTYPGYESLGRRDCILREDAIDLLPAAATPFDKLRVTTATATATAKPITIPLADLRSFSAELKVKFQLRTEDHLYQLIFDKGSPLQWQVYLKGMLPHLEEGLTRNTDYANSHGLTQREHDA